MLDIHRLNHTSLNRSNILFFQYNLSLIGESDAFSVQVLEENNLILSLDKHQERVFQLNLDKLLKFEQNLSQTQETSVQPMKIEWTTLEGASETQLFKGISAF